MLVKIIYKNSLFNLDSPFSAPSSGGNKKELRLRSKISFDLLAQRRKEHKEYILLIFQPARLIIIIKNVPLWSVYTRFFLSFEKEVRLLVSSFFWSNMNQPFSLRKKLSYRVFMGLGKIKLLNLLLRLVHFHDPLFFLSLSVSFKKTPNLC